MRYPVEELKLSHKSLVEIGSQFLKVFGCGIILKEMVSHNNTGEIPDIFAMKHGYSILLEVKVSRTDFLADSKKIFRQMPELGMGQYRFFFCPEGIITEEDLRGSYEGWGLLYLNNKQKVDKIIFLKGNFFPEIDCPVKRFNANIRAERSLLFSALRRKQGGK